MGWGLSNKEGQAYSQAMDKLLLYGEWDENSYNNAMDNFIKGSSVNITGVYNNFKINKPDENPLIKKFFPLIR